MIIKTDAPDGYEAVIDGEDDLSCSRCDCEYDYFKCDDRPCTPEERADGEMVVFKLIDTLTQNANKING